MKQGSFGGLLLREWYLMRRSLLMSLAMLFGVMSICVLISLSFYYGNLAPLLKDSPEAKEQVMPMLKWIGVFMAIVIFQAVTNALALDQNRKWTHFFITTPVNPMRIAYAKLIMICGSFLLAAGLGFGYLALICGINDLKLDRGDAAICACILIVTLLMPTIEIALLNLLHMESAEKAALCALGIEIIPVVIYSFYKIKYDPIDEADMTAYLADLLKFAEDYILPASPFIILALLAACCIVTAVGLKRREK